MGTSPTPCELPKPDDVAVAEEGTVEGAATRVTTGEEPATEVMPALDNPTTLTVFCPICSFKG